MAAASLDDLLPPEQRRQLAELLTPVLAHGHGVVVLVVENHRVHHLGGMPFFLTIKSQSGGRPPDWYNGEGGSA